MTVDGVLVFIGLLINAAVVFNVMRLQLRLQRTLSATAAQIKAIHDETNGMRAELELAATAKGKLEGIAEEIKRNLRLPVDDTDVK